MLMDAFKDSDVGIKLRYQLDEKRFNLKRLQAKTKTRIESIRDFLFADGCALIVSTEADMQHSVNLFSVACTNFGLTISTKKTEVLHQPISSSDQNKPSISVNGQKLSNVNRFTYLGSTLSQEVHIDDEINTRIARASSSFGRLQTTVWNRRGIKPLTKIKVYTAAILPILLYACETWTVYSRHEKRLNHFHMTCLRKILKIKWQDRIPDTEVLQQTNMPSIFTLLRKAQLRWAGHVVRMSEERLPKKIFFGEFAGGKRSQGGQKKRYKDTLKATMKNFAIDHENWESLAVDRAVWRASTYDGAIAYESKRHNAAIDKRQRRKAGTINSAFSNQVPHPCPHCGRVFRAQICLISQLKTHNQHT